MIHDDLVERFLSLFRTMVLVASVSQSLVITRQDQFFTFGGLMLLIKDTVANIFDYLFLETQKVNICLGSIKTFDSGFSSC